MSVATIMSCHKNNDVNSGKVELLSFGPTGAKPGDTLRFIGNNLNKVTSIQFTGTNAGVDQKDFKQQSSELILLILPPTVEKGYVTLKTPDGDVVSKTQFNANVTITVTSITAQARPGDNVTIKGTYLNWVNSVTFYKDKAVTSFVSQAAGQLVVKIPDDAQTGTLILHYGGTDSADLETTDTLKVTLPLITSLSPNPVKHQTNDTITGTDLDLVKKIIFTGVSSPVTTFVSQSATQLVVQVPAATQKGKVTLEAASGIQTTSANDLDVVLPSITTMTPNPIDPGTNLTVTGTNLDLVTSIAFQNAPAVTTFVSQSATQIVVTAPMGIARGQITLGVLNSTVTVQSTDILEITGAAPPPSIALPIYDDAVTNNWTSTGGWTGGGWGGSANYSNTSPVRAGTKSVRIDYVGGYGSPLQLGGANINLAPYTTFKISVYGAPGSGGHTVSIAFNSTNNKYNLTVVEGQWTDYVIPISTLTSSTTLTDIWVQEFSGTGGYTIYVDAIGLN
jgi:hypothetical protein